MMSCVTVLTHAMDMEQEELQRVVEVVHRIGKQACDLWPEAKTALFGSQVRHCSYHCLKLAGLYSKPFGVAETVRCH